MFDHLLHRSGHLEWLDTDAGALILMSVALKPHWSGNELPKDGRVVQARFRYDPELGPTDYDRACDVEDYVGLIPVAQGVALVLGQDPLPTAWQPLPNGGGLLARLYTCELPDFPSELPSLSPDVRWEAAGEFAVDGSPLILFDSTETGDEPSVFPTLSISLDRGHYAVEHTKFANAEMELWLVRLRPI